MDEHMELTERGGLQISHSKDEKSCRGTRSTLKQERKSTASPPPHPDDCDLSMDSYQGGLASIDVLKTFGICQVSTKHIHVHVNNYIINKRSFVVKRSDIKQSKKCICGSDFEGCFLSLWVPKVRASLYNVLVDVASTTITRPTPLRVNVVWVMMTSELSMRTPVVHSESVWKIIDVLTQAVEKLR